MASVSLATLRSRLAELQGRGSLSTALTSHYNRVINMALRDLAASGKLSSLTRFVRQKLWGQLTASTSAETTAGSSIVTFTGETFLSKNVLQGDILSLAGNRHYGYAVTNTTIDVGAPMVTTETIAAASCIIYRRGLKLPGEGSIYHCQTGSGSADSVALQRNELAYTRYGVANGQPQAYSVIYDVDSDATVVTIWPAPTASSDYVTISYTAGIADLTADTSTVNLAQGHIDSVLFRANEIDRNLTGTGLESAMVQSTMRKGARGTESGSARGNVWIP